MNVKKLLALGLALVMVFALVACVEGEAGPARRGQTRAEDEGGQPILDGPKPMELNVGVFYYHLGDTYIASVRDALDKALDAGGVQHKNYDCLNDQATQNDAIQTALADGANLLIVNMVNYSSPDAARVVMDMAGDVPVIFFNRAVDTEDDPDATLKSSDQICFIGRDISEAGHIQGRMIGEYLVANYEAVDLNGDGVISYAMFKGDETNVEATYRTQYGVEDADAVLTAAGKPKLEYFDSNNPAKYQVDQYGSWSELAAWDYMSANLAQYNEDNGNMIELVICNGDAMAEGAIFALNDAGYNTGSGKTIPVFGIDGSNAAKKLIAEGKMTGTVQPDAEVMARAIAETVFSIGAGSSVTEAVAAAGTAMCTVAEGVANKLYVPYFPYMGDN